VLDASVQASACEKGDGFIHLDDGLTKLKIKRCAKYFYERETFQSLIQFIFVSGNMSTVRKIAIGLGLASGALLAAWLLTGHRGKKTREYLSRKAGDLKRVLRSRSQQIGERSPEGDPTYI
jgi:hypothetical protein